MKSITLFTIICSALMAPFVVYLAYEFVSWLLTVRRCRGKEQYVFYEVTDDGKAVRIEE